MRWKGKLLDELKAMAAFGLSMEDAAFFMGITRSTVAGAADRNHIPFTCQDYGATADKDRKRFARRAAWTVRVAANATKTPRADAKTVLVGRQRHDDGSLMAVHPMDRGKGPK